MHAGIPRATCGCSGRTTLGEICFRNPVPVKIGRTRLRDHVPLKIGRPRRRNSVQAKIGKAHLRDPGFVRIEWGSARAQVRLQEVGRLSGIGRTRLRDHVPLKIGRPHRRNPARIKIGRAHLRYPTLVRIAWVSPRARVRVGEVGTVSGQL
jgi:aspartate ammonia-lyase